MNETTACRSPLTIDIKAAEPTCVNKADGNTSPIRWNTSLNNPQQVTPWSPEDLRR